MRLVLSPYDLSSRSVAAFTAVLLAEPALGVTTLLPRPFGDPSPSAVRDAATTTPRYQRLIDHWRWSAPLWKAGVLRGEDESGSPLDEARALCRRIEADGELEPLRRLVSADLLRDEAAYLDAVSRDLLRGGGDPAISVPIEAGIAMFAARRGAMLVRGPSAGAARRHEAPRESSRLRLSLQIPTRGEAAELLIIRDHLAAAFEPVRASLRGAVGALIEGALDKQCTDDLARCCEALSAEFAASIGRGGVLARRGLDTDLLEPAIVTMTMARAPADADLLLAARALQALHGAAPRCPGRASAALAIAPVTTLTIKVSPFDARACEGRAAAEGRIGR